MLDYEDLDSLLNRNKFGEGVNNTALQEASRKLMELAFPTETGSNYALWDCFYVPMTFSEDNITMPITVREDIAGYTSVCVHTSKPLIIFPGEKEVEPDYFRLLEEALKFSQLLREKGSEALVVPYYLREGKVKSKHVLKEVLSAEERKRIEKKYRRHLETMGKITAVSRNQYLETAAIIMRKLSDGWTEGLSPEQIHRRSYCGGGSMWDVKDPDSPEEFTEWVKSGKGPGEHAFSIKGKGRHLYPPSESKPFFDFSISSEDHRKYVAMLDALIDADVIFKVTDLQKRLDLLSGESYIPVNEDIGSVTCFGPEKEFFPYVEWDSPVLPRWRGL